MGFALLFSFVSWWAVDAAQIPILHVSPLSQEVVIDSQAPPAPQQVRIRNTGSGSLRWTASPAAPWLRVTPRAGSGPAVLMVEVDRAGLAPGRHQGRVTIDAGDADDSPVSITITVEVNAAQAPDPSTRAAAPAGAAQAAGPPPPATRSATRPEPPPARDEARTAKQDSGMASGGLRIDRQTLPPATRNLPYAQAIPISGGTAPYAVRIVEGRLPAGLVLTQSSISGTARVQGYYPFVIRATDSSTPPVTLLQPLAIRVIILQADTALVVSPSLISIRLPGRSRDGHARLSIASGRQMLDWNAAADVAWLRVVPASGVSPAAVEIVALAGQLSPGTHLGTVTVTMEGAPNSPASIPVQITVPR
jgi:hypothetical protein